MGNIDSRNVAISAHEIKELPQDARNEAITALIALGYTKAEAFNAVASVNDESLTSEEYIKKALKNLF